MVYGDFQYLFLDEIQNIEEWFLFVNRLLRQKIHLIITGSNAKLLSSELSTHLTGRYNQIELYPFSFTEFCQYRKIDTKDISTKGVAFKKLHLKTTSRKEAFLNYLRLKTVEDIFKDYSTLSYVKIYSSVLKSDI